MTDEHKSKPKGKRPTSNYQVKTDSDQASNGKPKVQWRGYVNHDLTAAEKQAYAKYAADAEWLDRAEFAALSTGHSIKVSWYEKGQCVRAVVYCENAENPNAGWALSAFAESAWEARARVLFLHHVVFETVWRTADNNGWFDPNRGWA